MVNKKDMNKQQLVNITLIIGTIITCCALFGIITAICLEKSKLIWYCAYVIAIAAIMFGVPFFVNRSKRKIK